jgi:hypothetical protein
MRAGACAAAISSLFGLVAWVPATAQSRDVAVSLNDLLGQGFDMVVEGQLLDVCAYRSAPGRAFKATPEIEI